MPAFQYKSVDAKGRIKTGLIEADGQRQARQLLIDKGWAPLQLEQAEGGHGASRALPQWGRLFSGSKFSVSERALVTRQMATLLRSGLPIEQVLGIVARQTSNQKIERIMLGVRSRVLEGYSVAKGMEAYSGAFPAMYRATVAAGEQSGHLEDVLERLAEYLEERNETGRSVAQSLVYPLFILVFSLVIVVLLMTFVVPRMVDVFAQRHQELPFLTRAMIGISDFISSWWWLMLLLAVASVAGFLWRLQDDAFRNMVHQRVLKVPLVGGLLVSAESARFASTLSILVKSGVPLVDALKLSAGVVSNLVLQESISNVTRQVQEGRALNRAMADEKLFPEMLVQMIASGEASGDLHRMLERAANYQESELRSLAQSVVGLLGPVMLVSMAGFVFLVVWAMMSPIMDMNALMSVGR